MTPEEAKKSDKQRERWTLTRAARDFHERVMEPTRRAKFNEERRRLQEAWANDLAVPPAQELSFKVA